MNNTFVTHPSVRIKGTENNYNPAQCFDPLCHDKSPHMHCPFCMKNEFYTDPVILKAHYRVKHVDKGIDFAGLKVLRCCDQCDIVGVIKGEKKFKGAHWHCYKCRNGFNRRDEAIKHYKTHFRNPQTTFQIQIAQEVNQSLAAGYDADDATTTIASEEFSVQSIHPVLTEAITCMTTGEDHGFSQSSLPVLHRSLETSSMPGVGAVETVGVADTQTIMIIQEDGSISALPDACTTQDVSVSEESASLVEEGVGEEEGPGLEKLHERLHELEQEQDKHLKQIAELQKKVETQEEQLAGARAREQGLLEQLQQLGAGDADRSMEELCAQLAARHRDLLQQQLTTLRRTFLATHTPNMVIVNGPLNGALTQQIALQTLDQAPDPDTPGHVHATHDDIRIHFQTSNNETVVSDSSHEAQSSIVSVIETSTGELKCEIDNSPVEKEPQFEMLQPEFTDSLDEDRLQIEDENIPIENDGQEPPSKRKKEK